MYDFYDENYQVNFIHLFFSDGKKVLFISKGWKLQFEWGGYKEVVGKSFLTISSNINAEEERRRVFKNLKPIKDELLTFLGWLDWTVDDIE